MIITQQPTLFPKITGMKPEYYNAAMEGNIHAFEGKGGEEIESILTPNKNTILHIHFTSYTHSVSDTFVEEVLRMCPALFLKTNVKDETILHIAARYGHHKIVRKLIDCAKGLTRNIDGVGVEEILIRATNDKEDTALHEAARYGHTEVVKILIEEEPDHSYFSKNDGGETPLYIAVERRYWNVVNTILDNSNSPQYDGPNGRTALHAATIFGDGGIVSQLLSKNLSVAKEADENGLLPLHLAALHGNNGAVKELVSKDRSTAYMKDNMGRTALHLAALEGNMSAMEIILKCCPDCCELVDKKGCNALHYTTMDDKSYVISKEEKEILKNTPQLKNLCNEKDDDGNTPLHYIARLPKWETCYNHALLEPQVQVIVDTMACNKYSQNPLDVAGADMTRDSASKVTSHLEVVQVLIEEEPDHSYFGKNDGGETPLYIAVERRYWNVVKTILDNSNSPQYDGPNGRTALHVATIFGDGGKVSELLTKTLSVAKEADENGWLPLHLAALHGNKDAVKELVSKDRSTAYMKDNMGRTALHLAVLEGNMSAMEIILKYCPHCCELVDNKGRNALHYTTMDDKSYVISEEEKEILKNTPQMKNLCNEKDDDGNTPLHYIARLPKWETRYNHALLEPEFRIVVDTMACNKYGQNPFDVAGADMTQDSASKNKLFGKLQGIGALLGGRVLDKRLREKEQDSAVDENKTNDEDFLSGIATSLSVVAMLIATVTFAAGFTLPGGLNQDKGSPILKSNAAFIAFVITDSLSFVLSTSSILLLFYSSLGRKERKLGKELHGPMVGLCLRLTSSAMIYMVIAFGTGLFAVLGVSRGFGIVTLLIVLFFFIVIYVLPIGAFVDAASRQGVVTEMPSVLDYATSSPLWSLMRNMRAVNRAIHIVRTVIY
ncbi:hypothetical protein K1719_011043 [Acacia pycnantha]|nr:hypothetical protein K1719_011043 [Acacia pycnantha]